MNSKEAYECYRVHRDHRGGVYDYCNCKNCKYANPLLDPCCNIELITSHMYRDLAGCHNTIESLQITKADYEKEIEDLNQEIRRLKLSLPMAPLECYIDNTLTVEKNVSLNDLLNLPNIESISIWLNKKEDKNE